MKYNKIMKCFDGFYVKRKRVDCMNIMTKKRSKKLALLLVIILLFNIFVSIDRYNQDSTYADTAVNEDLQPAMSYNVDMHNYKNLGVPVFSQLVLVDTGYMRVEFNWKKDNKLIVEYYDNDFNLISKKDIDTSNELPGFGGFYEGDNYYYIVYKEDSPIDETGEYIFDSTKEFMRVVKYDKNWNRLDAIALTSDNCNYDNGVASTVTTGSLRMVENNDHLYIQSCYFGQDNHQRSMLFDLLTEDMSLAAPAYKMSSYYTSVSHSFNQFLLIDNDMPDFSRLVLLNHGDAWPTRA